MRTRNKVIEALAIPVGLLMVTAIVGGVANALRSKVDSPTPATVQPPPKPTKTESLACLSSKGLVDTCQEVWIDLSSEVPTDASAEVDGLLAQWAKERLRPAPGCAKSLRFSKRCSEQFANDPAVATCAVLYTIPHKQKGDIMVHADQHYYDARAAGNKDLTATLMASCEQQGGESPSKISRWDTVSLSSAEYSKAYKRADQAKQGSTK